MWKKKNENEECNGGNAIDLSLLPRFTRRVGISARVWLIGSRAKKVASDNGKNQLQSPTQVAFNLRLPFQDQWMANRLAPTRPIFRARLGSKPSNGFDAVFIPQIRKLVFEYCDKWPSSANARTYLYSHLVPLAEQNPHVEIIVKQRNQKEPIVRGFYCVLSSLVSYSFTYLPESE